MGGMRSLFALAVVVDGMMGRMTFGEGVVYDKVAVGHSGDDAHLVADEQDGGLGFEAFDDVEDAVFELAVDIAEGFVEHEQPGLADEGAAEERALELSAGEDSDALGRMGFQLHHFDHLPDLAALVGLGHFHPDESGGYHLVDRDGEMGVDHVFLREIARRREGVGIYELAGGGLDEAEDDAQEGGLATAVGAGDGYEVAGADAEVDVAEYVAAVAVESDPLKCDDGAAHCCDEVCSASASATLVISSSQRDERGLIFTSRMPSSSLRAAA